jgi:uncharacterized protein (TIGR03790 family)
MRSVAVFFGLSLALVACDSGGDAGAGGATSGSSQAADAASGTGTSATSGTGGAAEPHVLFPRTGITADQVGVLINDDDPLSVAVAEHYVAARSIPAANVVHLHLPSSTSNAMTDADFEPLKAEVDAALGPDVQALAITWTKPYAVDNMSVTSAFALGYCAIGDTCNDPNAQGQTPNPYTSKPDSTLPFTELGFRPAMTIPATTFDEAKAIIDRGVASDATWPMGTAYLMNTSDQTRSARCILNPSYGWTNECATFLESWDTTLSGIDALVVDADSITGKTDVLFYVQGLASVPDLDTNTYLPGAVADHLTSYGGQIPTSGQMSAFEFLRAGATGSYGTVVEPCAYQQKFPNPAVLVPAYFGGATLVEAYWKSVLWPAEGIFIGEPLARPFGPGFRSSFSNGALTITTTAMVPGRHYAIEAADADAGPFTTVLGDLSVPKYQIATFTIPNADRATYRFREAP